MLETVFVGVSGCAWVLKRVLESVLVGVRKGARKVVFVDARKRV